MEQKKKQNHKLYGGFQYAFAGIVTGLKQEQNMKMHAVMTVLVVIAGFFFSHFYDRMVYLSVALWSYYGIGVGEYSSGSGCGSCD